MKTINHILSISASLTLVHSISEASIVTPGDSLAGGIPYRWTVTMDDEDSASFSRHVGAWAWQDQSLFNPGETPVGWTHNSEWVALTLSAPAMVTLRLTNAAGVPNGTLADPNAVAPANLFPGMTVFAGWDNDLAPQAFANTYNGGDPTDNWHFYVNRSNVEWAEDISYFTHLEPNGTQAIEATMQMPAGQYTMVIGGKSPSETSEPRQGYLATFTTAPVPEPSTAGIAVLGGIALLVGWRRTSH